MTSPIDSLGPPPEDPELNTRMEMLFEEYRKVERGYSSCRNESGVSKKKVDLSTDSKVKTKKKSGIDSSKVAVPAGRWSVRANSVGDLLSSPTSSCLTLHKSTTAGRESRYGGSSTSLTSRSTTPSSLIGRRSSPLTPRGTSSAELQSSSGRGRKTAGTSRSSTNTQPISKTTSVSRRQISNGRCTPEPHWSGEGDVVSSSTRNGTLAKSTSTSGSVLSRSMSDVSSRQFFSVPSSSSIGRELVMRATNRGNQHQQPQHEGRSSKTTGRCSPMELDGVPSDVTHHVTSTSGEHHRDQPIVRQQNGMTDHTISSLPRSRIPVPVSSSCRRSSSRPRYENTDVQQSFVLRRFDSGVDLGNSLSPTADYGSQYTHPAPYNPPTMTTDDVCDVKLVANGLHSFGPDRTFADDEEFY